MQQNPGLIGRLYEQLPHQVKVRTGEHVYDAYLKLRRKLVKAEVKTCGSERHMAYFEIDQGHTETLLFLHGFADSKDTFYDACHFLQGDFNIICPDLPGFGQSQKLKDDIYSLENYGRWVTDFIDKIGLKDFHLAGNSMGGAIAAQVALIRPDLLKSLTLIDPAGVYIEDHHSIHHELFDGNVIFDVRNRDQFEYFLNRIFHRRPFLPPPVKDFFYKEFHRHARWHRKILNDLLENLDSADDPRLYRVAINQRLKKITTPTLIVWGDEDTLFPVETAYVMHRLIEGSKLAIMPDIGHCPQLEAPRQFARVLSKFVKDINRQHEDEQARSESEQRRKKLKVKQDKVAVSAPPAESKAIRSDSKPASVKKKARPPAKKKPAANKVKSSQKNAKKSRSVKKTSPKGKKA